MKSQNNGAQALPEKIVQTVTQYVSLLRTGTGDLIADLYAQDATVEDPVGAEPRRGRDEIRQFYSKINSSDTVAELITLRVCDKSDLPSSFLTSGAPVPSIRNRQRR